MGAETILAFVALGVALAVNYLSITFSPYAKWFNNLVFGKEVAPGGWKVPVFTVLMPFLAVFMGGKALLHMSSDAIDS